MVFWYIKKEIHIYVVYGRKDNIIIECYFVLNMYEYE